MEEDFGVGFDADDEFTAGAVEPWDLPQSAGPQAGGMPGAMADPYEVAVEPLADPFEGLGATQHRHVIDEPHTPDMGAPQPPPMPAHAARPASVPSYDSGAEGAAPRIAIHIFCEQPSTATVAENAAADRRLARTTPVVLMGGLSAAVAHYQNQPTPSLVVVESQDNAAVLISQLDQLAEVCDPGTKVVVIGRSNDIGLYRELMKRGVSEYLVPPLEPLNLVQAITTLYSDPSAPFIGRTIAFIGAKGGSGSSTIAHNFGHCLTEFMQTNAVIVDFDLPFGTAGLDFNQDPLQGVADALNQPDRLDPVLLDRMMVRCSDRLSLFAAPANLDNDYDISPEAFEEVAAKIKHTAPFVILDLPHIWSSWVRKLLLSSDEVVIVATPDLASLRNAKNMIDLVRAARPNDQPPRLVINQTGIPNRPEIPVKDFGEAMGLMPSLVLPFDAKLFGAAANNGQMICEVAPKSKAAEGLNALAQLISRRDPPPQPKKSLLASLLKK